MTRVMIVDDEIEIAEMIEDFLTIEGIEVIKASSGEQALELFDQTIDSVVLDINMPGINGIQTCKEIRSRSFVPIIFLTCNNSQSDMVLGLGLGADDYITKPFNPVELVARIKANLRRANRYTEKQIQGRITDEIMTFGDIVIYKQRYKVFKGGVDIQITSTEFKLLLFMAENALIVLTRSQILNHVWGSEYYDENLVNTTIKRLRKKIEDNLDKPGYIKTIHGVGYVLEGKVR